MDHPALFPPGLHPLSDLQLDQRLVLPFPDSRTRPRLIAGFRNFVGALQRVGIAFEIWIDGSFCTEKTDPNDVDLVLFASQVAVNGLDIGRQHLLSGLVDRPSSKRQYGCDVLFSPSEDENMRSYWRGWYGFDRSERPKGIVKLMVTP